MCFFLCIICKYNKQHEVASVSHEIKHMIVNSNSKWIYFTNPSSNQPGIYRVPTKGGHAELLANDVGFFFFVLCVCFLQRMTV